MKISDVIKALEESKKMYGDKKVIFRDAGSDDDFDVLSVYFDDDADRVVASDFFYLLNQKNNQEK